MVIKITNDTTTLNGALTELGETLAVNLTTQGVTASASDGLTTLANKVLDIQTGGGGGHCYSLKFSQDTYMANSNGNATLTLTLLDCGEAVEGATITLSNNSTVTTNSSGVATATVTITQDTVFTATYDESTASCTVKKDALIFTIYDSYFKSYNTAPFTFTGSLTVDWGDGTTETYTSGYLEHTYSTIDEHTVTITGNITQLNSSCFAYCYSLKEVHIPDSVTLIYASCFDYCYALENVNIGNSVTSLGNNCFRNCYALENVNIGNSVTSLGNSCFNYCYSLKEVHIPDSVTSLGNNCFYVSGLFSLEIGAGVTTIGTQVIRNCYSLRKLKFKPTTPPTIGANSSNYGNLSNRCKIYVPSGTLSNYTSAANYPSSSTYTYVEY